MQKKSAQSDRPTQRKRPKCVRILLISANSKIAQYFGTFVRVFSKHNGPIEPIPFALVQASSDTSLEYPQHRISVTLKFHYF